MTNPTRRIGSLNRENPVEADEASSAFAKAYIASHRSAYRSPYAETPADECAAQRFHGRYFLMQTIRTGFAGSGEWLYAEHRPVGEQGPVYRFRSGPSGRGFYGTLHIITAE